MIYANGRGISKELLLKYKEYLENVVTIKYQALIHIWQQPITSAM